MSSDYRLISVVQFQTKEKSYNGKEPSRENKNDKKNRREKKKRNRSKIKDQPPSILSPP